MTLPFFFRLAERIFTNPPPRIDQRSKAFQRLAQYSSPSINPVPGLVLDTKCKYVTARSASLATLRTLPSPSLRLRPLWRDWERTNSLTSPCA